MVSEAGVDVVPEADKAPVLTIRLETAIRMKRRRFSQCRLGIESKRIRHIILYGIT